MAGWANVNYVCIYLFIPSFNRYLLLLQWPSLRWKHWQSCLLDGAYVQVRWRLKNERIKGSPERIKHSNMHSDKPVNQGRDLLLRRGRVYTGAWRTRRAGHVLRGSLDLECSEMFMNCFKEAKRCVESDKDNPFLRKWCQWVSSYMPRPSRLVKTRLAPCTPNLPVEMFSHSFPIKESYG